MTTSTRIAVAVLLLCALSASGSDVPTIPESLVEAYAVNSLGFLRSPRSEVVGALNYFLDSLEKKRAAGDLRGEAHALNAIGVLYFSLGDNERALPYLEQALARRRALGDKRAEANAIQNLALVQTSVGALQDAVTSNLQALRLMRSAGDRNGETYALNSAGRAYMASGDSAEALRHFSAAFELSRSIADRRAEAHTLNNLGALYESIGDLDAALMYYSRALEVKQVIGDQYGQALVLNNLGVVEIAAGQRTAALKHFDAALPLLRGAGDRYSEAYVLNNLGVAWSAAGEKEKARDAYTRSLAIRREVADRRGEALTLFNLAVANGKMTRADESLLEESRAISRELGDSRGEVAALHALGRLSRDRGDLADAQQKLEKAIEIVETMRDRIGGRELRASFSASRQTVYESYIDVLMQLHRLEPKRGFDAAALQWAEQSRARGLLDLLGSRRDEIRGGIDPDLLARERALSHQLSAKADRYMRLISTEANAEAAGTVLKELEQLKTENAVLETEIRTRNPRYSALTHPSPSTLRDIQHDIVDRDTLLLEYVLGDDRSYLWAVTRDHLASFELPPRAEIESAARSLYALLGARGQRLKFETDDEKRARVRQADRDYWSVAARLSRLVLGPAGEDLRKKKLLIVADGALHYVPFAALPLPNASRRAPLIVDHEVISLPSASVLIALRRELADRKPPRKVLAVVADPVFEAGDPRLGSRARRSTTSATEPKRFDPHRLPFTRDEANSILSLVPEHLRRGLFGFEASRQSMSNGTLPNYRLLHFATHAWVDESRPELSALVLSQYDRSGRQQDGFLRLPELFNLTLNADLVVLSGCRTALGKPLRGEGLAGLARGFMYAGAKRLVVSLWNVNDRSTADLMKHFYAEMFAKKRRPAEALRQAQISMWKDDRWSAPYYWAAFVISGEPE